jgi:hypothetical protein
VDENSRNGSGSVLLMFDKLVSESKFFKKNGLSISVPILPTVYRFRRILTITDRFTGFDTGLPVIPIGKPVLDFSNAKFKFGTVFD